MQDKVNYYEILRIPNFSGMEAIKAAFRKLAKIYHPDVNGGARTEFQNVHCAYEILSDRSQREAFDKELKLRLVKEKKERESPRVQKLDIITKLEIILAYSTTRPSFRPHFACSCLNQLAEGRALSQKQLDSIQKIIISFEINIDLWLDEKKRNDALELFFKNENNR